MLLTCVLSSPLPPSDGISIRNQFIQESLLRELGLLESFAMSPICIVISSPLIIRDRKGLWDLKKLHEDGNYKNMWISLEIDCT